MHVSIVICTWNRAESLRETLASLCSLRIPCELAWEVIVVDNNCHDHTRAVVHSFESKLPVRCILEPRQGLSNARNAGIRTAAGELLIFTDDDIRFAPEWLVAYVDAAGRWPEAAYYGGPISPLFEESPPQWITSNQDLLTGMLGIRSYPKEVPLAAGQEPFGANIAFRRHVFNDSQFDPTLGVVAGEWAGGEETSLVARLREQGQQGIGVPLAQVYHVIPKKNATATHLWKWAYGWGRSTVRMARKRGDPTSTAIWRMALNRHRCRVACFVQKFLGRDSWAAAYYQVAAISGTLDELREDKSVERLKEQKK
jgi:glycosyltransferase involved in cell wall biosynthesis